MARRDAKSAKKATVFQYREKKGLGSVKRRGSRGGAESAKVFFVGFVKYFVHFVVKQLTTLTALQTIPAPMNVLNA